MADRVVTLHTDDPVMFEAVWNALRESGRAMMLDYGEDGGLVLSLADGVVGAGAVGSAAREPVPAPAPAPAPTAARPVGPHVADSLGITRSAANQRIARARSLGLLPPAERPDAAPIPPAPAPENDPLTPAERARVEARRAKERHQ